MTQKKLAEFFRVSCNESSIALFPFIFMKKRDLCFLLAAAALLPFTVVWANPEQVQAVETLEVVPEKTEVPADPESAAEEAKRAEEEAKRKAEAEAKKAEMEQKKLAQLEVRKLQMQKSKIDAEMALEQVKLRREMAPANNARMRLEVDNALRQSELATKFAEIDEAKRTIDAVAARDAVRDNLASLDRTLRLRERDLDARITRLTQEIEIGKCNLELTRSRLEQGSRDFVEAPAAYMKEPFADGTLYISDRRIDFNGPVTMSLAEHVIERLYFYNNQSAEYPIFIVVDSPGGSVFAGYQILKAIESSKAPVHVVVKGMAASMAAVITTLAPHSYCYENSIILHHQASSGVSGNMTVMAEQYASIKDWVERLFAPVCKKLGKTQEEFVKEMYAHFSTGDWAAWGTEAVEMRWVNHLADRIVETSVLRKPEKMQQMPQLIFVSEGIEKTDARGNAYVELPPLLPGDAWMIYDPKNRYRFAR